MHSLHNIIGKARYMKLLVGKCQTELRIAKEIYEIRYTIYETRYTRKGDIYEI